MNPDLQKLRDRVAAEREHECWSGRYASRRYFWGSWLPFAKGVDQGAKLALGLVLQMIDDVAKEGSQ
jgi:hypothetical protein